MLGAPRALTLITHLRENLDRVKHNSDTITTWARGRGRSRHCQCLVTPEPSVAHSASRHRRRRICEDIPTYVRTRHRIRSYRTSRYAQRGAAAHKRMPRPESTPRRPSDFPEMVPWICVEEHKKGMPSWWRRARAKGSRGGPTPRLGNKVRSSTHREAPASSPALAGPHPLLEVSTAI